MTPEDYLKFLYLLHGRNILKIHFWRLGENPHEDKLEKTDMFSSEWELYLYDNGFIKNSSLMKNYNSTNMLNPVKFTDKFWEFVENN